MKNWTHTIFAILVASPLAAQSTWVVDLMNRPGTDFTHLGVAVSAASPGDTLLLRYVDAGQVGAYVLGSTAITRGLTIVGVGGPAPVNYTLTVEQLPAGEHVVLRNLQIAPIATGIWQGWGFPMGTGGTSLLIDDCLGSVHLQNIVRDHVPAGWTTWNVENCKLVTLTECQLPHNLIFGYQFEDVEELVITRSQFLANAATAFSPTMSVADSTITLVDSTVQSSGSQTAINLCNAELRLGGPETMVGVGSGSAVYSCGTESRIVLGPGAQLGPTATMTVSTPVSALGAYVDNNHVLDVVVVGPEFGLAVLAIGDLLPSPVPMWGNQLHLGANTVVFDVVLLDASGRATTQYALASSLPPGHSSWLQAVTLDASLKLRLTPPAIKTTP